MQSRKAAKDFDGWIRLKKNMDKLGKIPTINEGEIWWCGIGENVGMEICGKGRRFSRPVLILKKYKKCSPGLSTRGIVGIPNNIYIIARPIQPDKPFFLTFSKS